jgi:hypothetical protein
MKNISSGSVGLINNIWKRICETNNGRWTGRGWKGSCKLSELGFVGFKDFRIFKKSH